MFKLSVTILSVLLLASDPQAMLALAAIPSLQNHDTLLTQTSSETDEDLVTLARQVTVRIMSDRNTGSGVLIGKKGSTYLIITNAHVTRGSQTLQIQTYDGKVHQAQVLPNALQANSDLALVTFTSPQTYQSATIAKFTPKVEQPILATGYSVETGQFRSSEGTIQQFPNRPLKEGYQIGYTSDIVQGMSGGPIFEQNTQELIGINGRSAYPIAPKYDYQEGSPPTATEMAEMKKVNWGVPINTLLTYINPEILTAYQLPLPQVVATVKTATYTGYLGELEAKAKQFLVKINYNDEKKNNGSGVIIAKTGKTYTVLTADHVLCEKGNQGQCLPMNYTFTTADGQTRTLNKNSIIRQEGVDLAIFRFDSDGNYAVAELADYNPNTFDYVFAAGFPKIGNNDPQWLFSGGQVNEKEEGLLQTRQSDFTSQKSGAMQTVTLKDGYELVYTSITYGGMSGGAVLDRQGRVIGIHGRAEGANNSSITQLGYSLGIPISIFVGLQDRFQTTPQRLTKAQPQISPPQQGEIAQAVDKVIVPSTNAPASIWIERGGQLWRLSRYAEAIKAFDEAIKQNNPENVYLAWFGKGQALGDNEQFSAAIEAFQQAIRTLPPASSPQYDPEFHSDILQRQSATYRYLKNYGQALTAINQAITLSPNNPNYCNEKKEVLSQLGRNDEALIAINQAIALNPRSAWYSNRGNLYYKLKKYDLALADFNQAINLNSNFANAYMNRGLLYQDLQKNELALADYNQAINLNSNFALAYNNRGNLYSDLQKNELALADLNQAINLDSNLALAYMNRGILYSDLQKNELALADLNKAIAIDSNFALAYNNRGILYKKLQKYDLALADYNQAINLNSNFALAYNNRGNLYSDLQKNELALADLNKAINLDSNLALAYMNRGILYSDLQKNELALADLNKAIAIDSNFALAYNNRGNLYKKLQKYDLALADYNQAINLNSNFAHTYYNRGNLYSDLQKYDLALADYNQAITLNPNFAEAYMNRGVVYLVLEKYDLALVDFNQAINLNLNLNLNKAYINRGFIYIVFQKYELALVDFSKAINLDSNDAEAYNNRGRVYLALQKYELALTDFNKAISIDSNLALTYKNRGLLYSELKKYNLALADYKKAADLFKQQGDTIRYESVMQFVKKLGG
jgi:tetratricopeptide (TPR) repeat protein/S1-C subfamily serine protease